MVSFEMFHLLLTEWKEMCKAQTIRESKCRSQFPHLIHVSSFGWYLSSRHRLSWKNKGCHSVIYERAELVTRTCNVRNIFIRFFSGFICSDFGTLSMFVFRTTPCSKHETHHISLYKHADCLIVLLIWRRTYETDIPTTIPDSTHKSFKAASPKRLSIAAW